MLPSFFTTKFHILVGWDEDVNAAPVLATFTPWANHPHCISMKLTSLVVLLCYISLVSEEFY